MLNAKIGGNVRMDKERILMEKTQKPAVGRRKKDANETPLEDICAKWNIDINRYKTWVSTEALLKAIDVYKQKRDIRSDRQLSMELHVKPQFLSRLRKQNTRVMASTVIKIFDHINIDPRVILVRDPKYHQGQSDLDPFTMLFLETFDDSRYRAMMIKYAKQVYALMDKINEQEKIAIEDKLRKEYDFDINQN